MHGLQLLDWSIVALYFLVILGIAWWVIRQKQDTSTEYFLAGRHVGWFVIGTAIFASNIGSEHIVGLAGTGAKSGVAMGHYELHAWCILLLGWVFVPFYMRSKVFTMPEFLERLVSLPDLPGRLCADKSIGHGLRWCSGVSDFDGC
jgi:SSS family solute:Na+ symporter